ncbi:hypothetical protein LL060_27045 [Escherichia coli]|nr:hypothetical protein [Escherichia coli]
MAYATSYYSPGATTLTRLISEVREKATLRLWNKLALIPSAEQRSQLEMLLGQLIAAACLYWNH